MIIMITKKFLTNYLMSEFFFLEGTRKKEEISFDKVTKGERLGKKKYGNFFFT